MKRPDVAASITSIVSVLLLIPLSVGAQAEVDSLARVQVDLWSDFDRPSVLVLITAEIPPEVPMPASVQIKIPASAGDPSAVAYINPNGEMFTTDYSSRSDGDATLLTIQTPQPQVRVEYYMPYQRIGDQVQFDYTWLGGAPIDDFTLIFQEPDQAIAVYPDERLKNIGVLSDGRRYYQWAVGAMGRDETLSASFRYTTSTALSPEGPGLPALIPVLTGVGGLLVGGGIVWLLTRRPKRPLRVYKAVRPTAKQAAFCPQCGAPHQPGDNFCRQCGQKVN